MKRVHALVMAVFAASCIAPVCAAPSPAGVTKPHATSSAAKRAAAKKRTKNARRSVISKAAAQMKAKLAALSLLAPADEYFGPLKQSILGIRNTIKDAGLRYEANHDLGARTVASIELTERAIRDWQKRYPRDHDVPKAIYALQRLYAKIETVEARVKAQATASWLLSAYGKSPPADELRRVLAAEQIPPAPAVSPTPPLVAPAPDTLPSPPVMVGPLPTPTSSPQHNVPR